MLTKWSAFYYYYYFFSDIKLYCGGKHLAWNRIPQEHVSSVQKSSWEKSHQLVEQRLVRRRRRRVGVGGFDHDCKRAVISSQGVWERERGRGFVTDCYPPTHLRSSETEPPDIQCFPHTESVSNALYLPFFLFLNVELSIFFFFSPLFNMNSSDVRWLSRC